MFILMMEGLSIIFEKDKEDGAIKGIKVSNGFKLTHILFIDDTIIFGQGLAAEWRYIKDLINLFCSASGLFVSTQKSSFCFNDCDQPLLD